MSLKRTSPSDNYQKNLNFLLKKSGLRAAEVARRSSVSARMIGFIKSGDRKPTLDIADAIAKVFNTTAWHMMLSDFTQKYENNEINEPHTEYGRSKLETLEDILTVVDNQSNIYDVGMNSAQRARVSVKLFKLAEAGENITVVDVIASMFSEIKENI